MHPFVINLASLHPTKTVARHDKFVRINSENVMRDPFMETNEWNERIHSFPRPNEASLGYFIFRVYIVSFSSGPFMRGDDIVNLRSAPVIRLRSTNNFTSCRIVWKRLE